MDITNSIRLYAECISGGAITEPTGGSWISAIAIWQGSTEPLNASWLQRHCDNLGITEPVNGSWLIALSYYYNEFLPINGTWANAILVGCGAVPTDLIWNLTTTEWQLETSDWATGTAPATPTFDQDGQSIANLNPTFTGTSQAFCFINLTIDGSEYVSQADAGGLWSILVTNALTGSASPGAQYVVDIVCKDSATGLESIPFVGSVGIVKTTETLTLQLSTGWSLYWYVNAIQIEQEVTPGNWTPIEYEGNIRYGTNFSKFYKQDLAYGSTTDPTELLYTMNFQQNDEFAGSQGEDTPREIILTTGFNYRIVARNFGGTSYGQYAYYEVFKDGTTPFLPFYNTPTNAEWQDGYVQQTFTL
jgi:hypothetical protein